MKKETMWSCKVGVVGDMDLPQGADLPMRRAIERAFKELTGRDAEFNFSGWGDGLSEIERVVVRQNGPGTDRPYFAGFDKGGRS